MTGGVRQPRRSPAALGALGAAALAVAAMLSACGGGGSDSVAAVPAAAAVVPPVLTISGTSSLTSAPVTLSFSFSQDVGTSFTIDDVVVGNGGVASAFTKVDATHYTVLLTPPAAGSGVISVAVAGSAYANATNGAGTTNSSVSQAYDTVPPTLLSLNSSAAGTTTGSAFTVTFTFSEDVGTSFTADDVVVGGGAVASAFTKVDASHYTLLITPPTSAVGSASISVAKGVFADIAGGTNAAAYVAAQAYDTVAPTLVPTSSAVGTASGPFTVTFTFSEDVGTSFTDADVSVVFTSGSGGSVGAVTRVSATQATVLVTPPVGAVGTANVSVAVGSFADLAGNSNVSTFFGGQSYDTRSGS